MKHLNDGVLRRLVDEPFAIADSQRRHLPACTRCTARFSAIQADAHAVRAALELPAFTEDRATARTRLAQRVAQVHAQRLPWGIRRVRPAVGRRIGLVGSGLALAGLVGFTPAGSLAQSFVTIFQPSTVAAIPLTSLDVRSIAQLRHYGTIHLPQHVPGTTVTAAQAASAQSGMHVRTPTTVPSGVPAVVSYAVSPGASASFTFSATKALAWANKHGKTLPAMPARVDGSVIDLTVGAAVVATYGGCTTTCSTVPPLVIGQMVAPSIASSRANLGELENYVFSLPGVSPQLATELRSIGDPTSTLPIPIPVALVHASPVTIDGVQGEEMGDQTGVGSLVVWEKSGIIYAVGGTLPLSQVESIANGLR